MLTISFTGHRSDKLPNKTTGYKPNPTKDYICKETERLLTKLKPDRCISGMALGYDSYAAQICIDLKIPFIAAVPFTGQEAIWPKESQEQYLRLLDFAEEVVIVSPGKYAGWKLQKRNEWMVDNSDKIIACWDGSVGGTKNCLDYAKKQNKEMFRIDPRNAYVAQ